jgi:hypothetical protein
MSSLIGYQLLSGSCLLMASWFGYRLWMALRSASWRAVEGHVGKAEIQESTDYISDDDDDRTWYSAHVRYTYWVDGRNYTSTRLSYQPTFGLAQSGAIALLAGITRGRKVSVYYDPDHPARSVLRPGASAANWWFVLVPIVVMLISGWNAGLH